MPAGCQWPKCRNRVGFDDPAGRTWRGTPVVRGASPTGATFGKKGERPVRRAAPPPGGAPAGPSPWRIDDHRRREESVGPSAVDRARGVPTGVAHGARHLELEPARAAAEHVARHVRASAVARLAVRTPVCARRRRGAWRQTPGSTRSKSRRSSSVRSPATARSAVVPAGSSPGATSQRSIDRMMSYAAEHLHHLEERPRLDAGEDGGASVPRASLPLTTSMSTVT